MEDSLKLEQQLCFPLYAVSRQITQVYKPLLDDLDITYPQYLALMVLWESGKQTVNQIGEKLLLDSGTLTPLLKRLEQKELVRRKRSAIDERIVEIALTSSGIKLKKKAACIPVKMFEQLGISMKEAEALKNISHKILNQINNHSK
ncbi:MarR family winged helix-turn-helix transcriptional regulator [Epilithonimonas hungarica]|uniref:DNA-binding transcriptional regulator, MarR family n=1 Tax=Epilithonimonas hungarica TaxID=454006 RepID=A0A1G7SB97_9FLAO|nr:MarR family transcriptional regulator [Epilithonimonas hungarica]SDG19729.1 DNA-binding transcriptional regulator, MarR family [Epilithonimonas hungarica]